MGFNQRKEDALQVVEVDGIRWSIDRRTGYYSGKVLRDGEAKRIRLHVYIWERENGKHVPKGYDIHHKDFNKANNSIENLIAITRSNHHKLHASLLTKKQKDERRRVLLDLAQPSAREWHKSKAGHEAHVKIAKDMNFGHHPDVECTCEFCGKPFIGKMFGKNRKSKFCSNAHKSAWRRKMHLDDVDRVCVVCGKIFRTNKNEGTKTCSTECWMKICGRPKGVKEIRPRLRNLKRDAGILTI